MQMSVPEVMDISQGAEAHPRDVRREAGQGVLRQQLPARAAARRAGRALRAALRLGLGHPRHRQRATTSSTACPKKCQQMSIRPVAALREGSEAARPARRHARRLGRRVRPHADERGHATAPSSSAAIITRTRFTIWMAGGGMKAGIAYGETDELGYHIAKDKVTSTTCRPRSSTCSGFDPHTLQLPLPGPEPTTHRPANEGRVVNEIIA